MHQDLASTNRYYGAYEPITLPRISFRFIKMKIIHCHSCMMFALKSMSDETRPRGRRFHTVSCQKLSLIYQFGELRVN